MDVVVGKKYKHFKGIVYKVIAIAKDSEYLKDLVVYQTLDKEKTWVRDYLEFTSLIDKEKYPELDGYRFTLID